MTLSSSPLPFPGLLRSLGGASALLTVVTFGQGVAASPMRPLSSPSIPDNTNSDAPRPTPRAQRSDLVQASLPVRSARDLDVRPIERDPGLWI